MEDEDFPIALNSLWGILGTVNNLLPSFLSAGHPIRGGIEVDGGITIEKEGNEIYGKVLNSAYLLESKQAGYPRVLIGSGLIKFLDST